VQAGRNIEADADDGWQMEYALGNSL